MKPSSTLHAMFVRTGQQGGRSRSPTKLAAIHENAKRGGRPRVVRIPLAAHRGLPVTRPRGPMDIAHFWPYVFAGAIKAGASTLRVSRRGDAACVTFAGQSEDVIERMFPVVKQRLAEFFIGAGKRCRVRRILGEEGEREDFAAILETDTPDALVVRFESGVA